MFVKVFGREDCGKCEAAKEKLERLGVTYEAHDFDRHAELHDGWREGGADKLLAAYWTDETLPVLQVDQEFLSYSAAMKAIKKRLRDGQVAV